MKKYYKKFGSKMNRKGQVEYLLQNAFRIGLTIIALLAFFLMINYYLNNKIDTRYIQAETLANRIIQSDSLMYQNTDTFRIYSGIVDMDKFNDKTSLDKSIKYDFNRHAAAKVKLYKKDAYGNSIFLGDTFLNKNNYDELKALINAGTSGKGSASMLIKDFPVTCRYSESVFDYCIMTVEVIVPNS